MKFDILGTEWTIEERSIEEDDKLEDCDGYCDWTTRLIVVEREAKGTLGDMARYTAKVKRHEIVHAFLYESGLAESACCPTVGWAKNEEMVDWFARMGPLICTAWDKASAILPEDFGRAAT